MSSLSTRATKRTGHQRSGPPHPSARSNRRHVNYAPLNFPGALQGSSSRNRATTPELAVARVFIQADPRKGLSREGETRLHWPTSPWLHRQQAAIGRRHDLFFGCLSRCRPSVGPCRGPIPAIARKLVDQPGQGG